MSAAAANIDVLSSNTIRLLGAEQPQKANSGHPGAPMGMAAIGHVLFSKHLNYNPKNPKWWNRDRFVLSNGHACALQYALLHLAGYDLSLEDLAAFRQINSKTPGHPEANHSTPGIEVTTGPLGQGFANGVGLALAQSHLSAIYNKPDFPIFNNKTYIFCGDGCMQEGITSEAASLAGHWGLSNVIVIYDNNKVQIDGSTNLAFSEDVSARFRSYHWNVIEVNDGDNDFAAMNAALDAAKAESGRPTLINLHTTIGFASKKQGTAKTHGEPLGEEDLKQVKSKFGFDPNAWFQVPQPVRDLFASKAAEGAANESRWQQLLNKYSTAFPKEHAELLQRFGHAIPSVSELISKLPSWKSGDKAEATRSTSGTILNAVADLLPAIMGGSADLTPSNKTELKKSHDYQKTTPTGRYIRFGVREHAMAAIGNGLFAYGGIIPYTATFFNFIEYAFPSVRLASLSKFQQIFIMTHDSIGLGEDGPTHQPVEAAALCRATPNLLFLRPADGNETTAAYIAALHFKNGPSVLALSRTDLPQLNGSTVDAALHGGYVLQDAEGGKPDIVLIASGSEVAIAVDTAKLLASNGSKVRVVSMPSTTLFDQQTVEYRRSVIPPGVASVYVEAATVFGLNRYSHFPIGLTTFGASGKVAAVYDRIGLTPPKISAKIAELLKATQADLTAIGQSAFPALPIHFHSFAPMQFLGNQSSH